VLEKFKAARKKKMIGFESEMRKEDAETRKNEAHQARLRLSDARAKSIEIDSEIRQPVELPFRATCASRLTDLPPVFVAPSAN
jgi:hypothetical protein